TLDIERVSLQPNTSLQDFLKGEIAGVYVQTPSGAPGSKENLFIRGLSRPILSQKGLFQAQPTIYLNGIPLIRENPFVYNIQKYKFNPIGPATNLLSSIDIDNIASIKVLKSADALALLGPRAANGAIMITTKDAH